MDENFAISGVKEEELSAVAKRLLKLQCIFMFEREMETLRNRNIFNQVKEYVQSSEIVNFHRILLSIVKCFVDKYFDLVKREVLRVQKNVPQALGEDLETSTNLLNKCLIVLEKRMFENLYNELYEEPLNYLTIFNMFSLDFIKCEEKYRLFYDNILKIKQEFGYSEENLITVKCINIFDLIKYVYYNAIIDAKVVLSQRIFKQFLQENIIEDMRKGKFSEDPCEYLMNRCKKPNISVDDGRRELNKQLNAVEYLIKEMWTNMPDLKNPINLKCEEIGEQISGLLNQREDNCDAIYEEDDEKEIINWNYLVTRDGETVYLNAPSYKYFEEFRPGLVRDYEYKPELTDADFDIAKTTRKVCNKPDIFDQKLDIILHEGKQLVGDELGPDNRTSKNERIMSYFKMRRTLKKKTLLRNEIWNQFQKTYFTFDEEDEEEKRVCDNPVRPQELYDLEPRYRYGIVRPIKHEFEHFKYICAACGFFINKGTGVEALGCKWHDEHFKCRICCEGFKEISEYILHKGLVICKYDAENMFNLKFKSHSTIKKNK